MHILFGKEAPSAVLTWINEGTPVYDRDGSKIGVVKHVYPGASGEDVYEPVPPVPEEMQQHLMSDGYIHIDCGLMWPERYATSDQIASLNDDGVWLNVPKNEVMVF